MWNIATQERKVCDMEVEIGTFVVKGSAQLRHMYFSQNSHIPPFSVVVYTTPYLHLTQ